MAVFVVIPWVESDGRREFLPLEAIVVENASRERVEASFPYIDGPDRGWRVEPVEVINLQEALARRAAFRAPDS